VRLLALSPADSLSSSASRLFGCPLVHLLSPRRGVFFRPSLPGELPSLFKVSSTCGNSQRSFNSNSLTCW